MQTENRNIYKKPREIAGYSQERAAELLDISVAVSYTHLDVYKRQPLSASLWQTNKTLDFLGCI